jgi:hypothetical protein
MSVLVCPRVKWIGVVVQKYPSMSPLIKADIVCLIDISHWCFSRFLLFQYLSQSHIPPNVLRLYRHLSNKFAYLIRLDVAQKQQPEDPNINNPNLTPTATIQERPYVPPTLA